MFENKVEGLIFQRILIYTPNSLRIVKKAIKDGNKWAVMLTHKGRPYLGVGTKVIPKPRNYECKLFITCSTTFRTMTASSGR
mmetsp:Transcript_33064/g.37953  ORF Transcript_33064/g.37953 Transcript_33064/m.37953 type:complete len:82 (-) Transcript_33064:307-552(-)